MDPLLAVQVISEHLVPLYFGAKGHNPMCAAHATPAHIALHSPAQTRRPKTPRKASWWARNAAGASIQEAGSTHRYTPTAGRSDRRHTPEETPPHRLANMGENEMFTVRRRLFRQPRPAAFHMGGHPERRQKTAFIQFSKAYYYSDAVSRGIVPSSPIKATQKTSHIHMGKVMFEPHLGERQWWRGKQVFD